MKTSKYKVLLCQLPIPQHILHDERNRWSNIPLAAGYLKAVALKAGLGQYAEITILPPLVQDLRSDAGIMAYIQAYAPDLLGASLYPWNLDRTLNLVKRLKRIMPGMKFIAGGPEVSPDSSFLLSYQGIDAMVVGEGEPVIVPLLEHFMHNAPDLRQLPGVGYPCGQGYRFNLPGLPVEDLDAIPSPYLTGIIDPDDYDRIWLETTRFCPSRCKYCIYHKRALGAKPYYSLERIQAELEFAHRKGVRLLDLHDANFNLSHNFLALARLITRVNSDHRMKLGIKVRAEHITPEIAALLAQGNVRYAEVGLQSINPAVLQHIGRVNRLDKFLQGVDNLQRQGIKVTIDTMVGLPGDTLESFKATVDFLQRRGLLDTTVFPSILSVGPRTDLRQEVKLHDLKYHSAPPYRVYSTSSLSYPELHQAMQYYMQQRGMRVFADIPMLAYDSKIYKPSPELLAGSHPITTLKLKLKAGMAPRRLAALGKKLAPQLANVCTVWFETPRAERSLPLMQAFMRALARNNPYNIWNIIIESRNPVADQVMQELKAAVPFKVNNLDYEAFFLEPRKIRYRRVSTRVFRSIAMAKLPQLLPEQMPQSLVSVRFKPGQDNQLILRRLKAGAPLGVRVEVTNTAPDFIIPLLLRIKQELPETVILFADAVLQQFWHLAFVHKACRLKLQENIHIYDPSLRLQRFAYQEKELLQHTTKLMAFMRAWLSHARKAGLLGRA